MTELHSLGPDELDRFVQRSKASSSLAEEVAEDVRAAITGAASIGVAVVDRSGDRENTGEGRDPVQVVLQRSDRAMYEAKEAGKNRVRVARADGDAALPLAGQGRVS